MALIMSLNESMFQAMPGAGIVLGGAITALAGPRVALAVAGGGRAGRHRRGVDAAGAWTASGEPSQQRRPEPESPSAPRRAGAPGGRFRVRAPRLHRHRLEHDAAAGRGVRRRAAARGPSGAGVHAHRSRRCGATGRSPPAKIAEVVDVVAAQLRTARELGAVDVRGVATAAIRQRRQRRARSSRRSAARCGLSIEILSGEEEARLAFVGAARTLGHVPAGELGVVDVGGGSSELVVGTAPDHVSWCTLVRRRLGRPRRRLPALRSARRSRSCRRRGPRSRRRCDGIDVPQPAEAVAVGGSATSLRRLAGPLLDADAFDALAALLAAERRGRGGPAVRARPRARAAAARPGC